MTSPPAPSPFENLSKLGLTLPEAKAPVASYVAVKKMGQMVYISGQISTNEHGLICGRLGENMDIEAGKIAAQQCALSLLAQIDAADGLSLDKVLNVVRLTVMVNATPEFTDHPQVANGASDLLVVVFGDKGQHARSAFGVASLPFGVAVEIDAQFEVMGP